MGIAIVKKVSQGWLVVSEHTGIPLVDRVFHSRISAKNFAAKYSPGMY